MRITDHNSEFRNSFGLKFIEKKKTATVIFTFLYYNFNKE